MQVGIPQRLTVGYDSKFSGTVRKTTYLNVTQHLGPASNALTRLAAEHIYHLLNTALLNKLTTGALRGGACLILAHEKTSE